MHAMVEEPEFNVPDLQPKFVGQSVSTAQLYGEACQRLMSVQPKMGPPHTS
jgi:hypothetical protein